MGFWILMAMLACALVAVVVALAIERPPIAKRGQRPADGAIRWLAVIPNRDGRIGDGWAERLAGMLPPTVEPQVAPRPGTTLSELEPAVREIVAERLPDVVLFWTALDDVLEGVPLPEYERALNDLLAHLDAQGVTAVLGNVPNLARLPGAEGAGLPEPEMRLLTDRWNGAIARLAHHHGALVADLSDLAPGSGLIAKPDPEPAHDGATATSTAVAARFVPVLRQALVGARRRRFVASATESL